MGILEDDIVRRKEIKQGKLEDVLSHLEKSCHLLLDPDQDRDPVQFRQSITIRNHVDSVQDLVQILLLLLYQNPNLSKMRANRFR